MCLILWCNFRYNYKIDKLIESFWGLTPKIWKVLSTFWVFSRNTLKRMLLKIVYFWPTPPVTSLFERFSKDWTTNFHLKKIISNTLSITKKLNLLQVYNCMETKFHKTYNIEKCRTVSHIINQNVDNVGDGISNLKIKK